MVDRPSLDRLLVITAAAHDGDDAARNGDDEFGWQPDEDDRIVLPAQQRFFENVVLPLLPTRKRQHGSERGVTEGEWKLNDGLIHRPPEPGLDGRSVTVESMCLVPVLVWCDLRPIFDSLWLTFGRFEIWQMLRRSPTEMFRSTAKAYNKQGQAPCPCGGWDHETVHQGWTAGRYVHAECRHKDARSRVHFCKTCKKSFGTIWGFGLGLL